MKILRRVIGVIMAMTLSAAVFGCGEPDVKETVFVEPELKAGLKWNTDLPCVEFPEAADNIDIISLVGYNADINATVQSLMAIVNVEKPRIALAENGKLDLYNNLGINKTVFTDTYELFEKYKKYMTKVVIYDVEAPHTINLATTYAGLESAIVCTFIGYTTLLSKGFQLEVIADYRGMFKRDNEVDERLAVYNYMYDNYYERCTRKIVSYLAPDMTMTLRDYSMAVKSAVIYLEFDGEEAILLDKFLSKTQTGNSAIMGWFPRGDETGGVQAATRHGMYVWGADHAKSLSFFAAKRKGEMPVIPLKSVDEYVDDQGKVIPNLYIALAMSDGDNLQYILGRMSELWNDEKHKSAEMPPITWTTSPAACDVMPMIHDYYVNSQATTFTKDGFMTGPSGIGYFYPSTMFGTDKQDNMMKFYAQTDRYCKKTGINVISTWFQKVNDPIIPEKYMELIASAIPNVSGMFFQRAMDSVEYGGMLYGGWNDPYNENPMENFKSQVAMTYSLFASDPTAAQYVTLQGVPWTNGVLDKFVELKNYAMAQTNTDGAPSGADCVKFITIDQLVQLQRIGLGLPKTRV